MDARSICPFVTDSLHLCNVLEFHACDRISFLFRAEYYSLVRMDPTLSIRLSLGPHGPLLESRLPSESCTAGLVSPEAPSWSALPSSLMLHPLRVLTSPQDSRLAPAPRAFRVISGSNVPFPPHKSRKGWFFSTFEFCFKSPVLTEA